MLLLPKHGLSPLLANRYRSRHGGYLPLSGEKPTRIRIVAVPSIGHTHAEQAIRRLLVEVPPNCPLPLGDINWAFSGLELHDPVTGELESWALVVANDMQMLRHYGIPGEGSSETFRVWRTVTAAVLPERAARRRIDPGRRPEQAKAASVRLAEESRATTAVLQALRHASVATTVESVSVQREPFDAKGSRAEAFASGTRFAKERSWHVEIAFVTSVQGPIIIGDGRYLGLGLMAPIKDAWRDTMVFKLSQETRFAAADSVYLLRAARRALMALSRDSRGNVPRLFSGHEKNGAPASSGRHEHIFLAGDDTNGDGRIDRLVVAAPWACDHSGRAPRRNDRALFDRVVSSLSKVRAGKFGVVVFAHPLTLAASDPIIGPARTWETRTLYRPTRHAGRGKDPAAAIVRDVIAECERRGLPKPDAELSEMDTGPNGGLAARVRLRFGVAIKGPIMLGRDSHMGGGMFGTVD